MNTQQQIEHFHSFTRKMEGVLLAKGDDYAGTDRLSNFKSVGAVTQSNGALSCLTLIATKVARLGVLLNSERPPKNEAIRDSVLDLANYAVLLDALLEDAESRNGGQKPLEVTRTVPSPEELSLIVEGYRDSLPTVEEAVVALFPNRKDQVLTENEEKRYG